MNGWVFTYARKDYANLFDEEEQKDIPHIFLDPVETDENYDEYGNIESVNYKGTMMVLVSSDLDAEDYDEKYQNNIKPIIKNTLEIIRDGIRCDGENTISNWRVIEVINVFDYNFDGVIITYSVDG